MMKGFGMLKLVLCSENRLRTVGPRRGGWRGKEGRMEYKISPLQTITQIVMRFLEVYANYWMGPHRDELLKMEKLSPMFRECCGDRSVDDNAGAFTFLILERSTHPCVQYMTK